MLLSIKFAFTLSFVTYPQLQASSMTCYWIKANLATLEYKLSVLLHLHWRTRYLEQLAWTNWAGRFEGPCKCSNLIISCRSGQANLLPTALGIQVLLLLPHSGPPLLQLCLLLDDCPDPVEEPDRLQHDRTQEDEDKGFIITTISNFFTLQDSGLLYK